MANTKNFIAKNGYSTGDGYDMPTVRPSLLLDFANSKTIDPRITFTRGSTATYWDGHTTTKAEENLQLYSSDFSATGWEFSSDRSTFTVNNATAPDGTTTAVKVAATAENGSHRVHTTTGVTVSIDTSKTYTLSFYVNAANCGYIACRVLGGNSDVTAQRTVFDASGSGSVISTATGYSASASITSVGNDWYRCILTATPYASTSTVVINYYDTSNNEIYTGSGEYMYLWGVQIEQRSSVTAYTPTTSQPIVKYQPVLQTAASGEARFDHDPVTGESKGLLIEEARTNLIVCSSPEDTDTFGANGWQDYYGFRAYKNTAIAPDGTQTAATVTAIVGGGTTGASMYVNNPITVSAAPYTFSAYMKIGSVQGFSTPTMTISNTGNASSVYDTKFDLSNGTINTNQNGTAKIEAVGNGWYLCSVTVTLTAGAKYPQVGSYGNAAAGSSFFMWGAQLELGSFRTSIIPTAGSTVTRSTDVFNMPMSGIYSSGPVTMYYEGAEFDVVDYSRMMLLSDGTNNNRMQINPNNTSSLVQAYVVTNGIIEGAADLSYNVIPNQFYKAASAFATGDNAVSAGGLTPATNSPDTLPQVTNLYLGSLHGADADKGGWFKKVALYPQRLSNATLQAMTEE